MSAGDLPSGRGSVVLIGGEPLLNNPEWLATVKRRCPAGRRAAYTGRDRAAQDCRRRRHDRLATASERSDPPGEAEEDAQCRQRRKPAREPLPVHGQGEREAGHARSLEGDLDLARRQV